MSSFAIPNVTTPNVNDALYRLNSTLSGIRSSVMSELHNYGVAIEDSIKDTTKKVQDLVATPIAQGVIGFGLGLGLHKIYMPLTEKVLTLMGYTVTHGADAFSAMSLTSQLLWFPYMAIIGPVMEELGFRGNLQEFLTTHFESFYTLLGASASTANIAARVTSVFFTSILFGLIHFTNALVFGCNPLVFLPQVIACIIMGLMFGLAKEVTGSLAMPIGMHIGNNTLACAMNIAGAL